MTVIMTSYRKEAMLQIRSGARQRLGEAANAVRNAALETLTGDRHGRLYLKPGSSKKYIRGGKALSLKNFYRASAPGEAPAEATGMLRQNVHTSIDMSELSAQVGIPEHTDTGTSLEYGVHLEYGTSRMKARPWLRPSFEKSLAQIKEILGRPWV